MRFLISADLHLHNKPYSNTLELGKQVLKDLTLLAQVNVCSNIVIVGDMWHQKHATPVEVLLAIAQWLDEAEDNGPDIRWLRGNHECQSRTNPEESLIRLFDGRDGIYIYNEPATLKWPKFWFHMVPWYPTVDIKKKLAEQHKLAIQHKEVKHYLFSHCGLKEGKVSADGFEVGKELSVKDLMPELYEFVILGDYHGHQFIGDNVLYVGEPVPRSFGSWGIAGAWVLDTVQMSLESVRLPSRYPAFIKTTFEEGARLDKVLDVYDRHRIYCSPRDLERCVARYPFAEVLPHESAGGDNRGELCVPLDNHQEVLKEYCQKVHSKEGKLFYAKARGYLEA